MPVQDRSMLAVGVVGMKKLVRDEIEKFQGVAASTTPLLPWSCLWPQSLS